MAPALKGLEHQHGAMPYVKRRWSKQSPEGAKAKITIFHLSCRCFNSYGIFSVNPKDLDVIIKYIERQDEHHKKVTFKDKFRLFLKNYNMDYYEFYLWD